jgi:UDP-N-acetylglucosamine 2-epimerase (non-hydrolysing)
MFRVLRLCNMSKELKLILVAGARPNFMKIAPLISAIKKYNSSINSINPRNSSNPSNSSNPINPSNPINYILVHTGQHYDVGMSKVFFQDLELPGPDINLEVGSSSHAEQTANIMIRFEKICLSQKPDWVFVVGDVNSTIACALVASKLGIKVAHVEAGLRSFDRSMPEEINRVITDSLADLLLTPSEDADANLIREGISKEKIKCVGNIMIDTLITHLDRARQCRSYDRFGMKPTNYVFVTIHRPSNVDSRVSLSIIMECLARLSEELPVIFPVHPRTRKKLFQFGLWQGSSDSKNLVLCEPLGYHETIDLVDKARFVLTDSGGLQEETTFLKVPCLTLRPNTERPVTIIQGTNKLTSLDSLGQDIGRLINGIHKTGSIPEHWDGHTAERIIKILAELNSEKMDQSWH